MTSTAVVVMQGNKRGDSSRKQQLRLPTIAPKDDQSSSASSGRSTNLGTSSSSVAPRARLPPRSRTGCWTCRTRKVKCDEGRPTCGQCTRLGHNCDYSPRLSFRDDTPRVVERMQDVSTLGSSIWDPTSPTPTDSGGSAIGNDLPPFAALTTDEERERKAECTSPGTYNVVVNPDSFQHLAEYSDDADSKGLLSPLRRGSLAASMASSPSKEVPLVDGVSPSAQTTVDPNVVILHRFEDTARRPLAQWKEGPSASSPLAQTSQPEVPSADLHMAIDPTKSLIYMAANGGQDWNLLQQFRDVVWHQLVQFKADEPNATQFDLPRVSVFEHAAAFFPPLFHAMMAVAALSLAHQEGKERLDALQHYQQALPALQNNLRTPQDLSSDGTFLTHFLLLVYEIAAAESGLSNLWSQHLAQLLRITLLRREVLGGERFPFITWWICNIDLYALFSGAGCGDFIGTMLKNDMIPPPSFHLYPLGMDGSSVIYGKETDTLPAILQLNYEVTVLAARLGLLAQELKHEVSFKHQNFVPHEQHVTIKIRQSRILELQESLRQLWVAPNILLIGQQLDLLPHRSRQLFEHASSLYRACLIFSHTSMWPSQRLDTGPEFDTEIALCVVEILQMAKRIVSAGLLEFRSMVFPLFMAGYASTDGNQKMTALDYITTMEKKSIGSNTTATRHALQIVYERQTQRFMHTGHSLDVDWTDVMVEQGLQVVNFGL